MSRFVHLHLHSQYSVLDGAIKIENLVARTKELKQSAVAITDHGNMHGVIEFYQAAKSAGVKPILGCEVYFTSGSRHDKTPRTQGGHQTHHLTLLAKNNQGYRNLCRLVSVAYLEGFYHKPRIDFELLSQWNEGLVCLSGCMAGELASFSRVEHLDAAEACARRYRDLFGERFYLEVQPHQFPEQQKHNAMLLELGKKLSLPLVATNDCHYLSPDDHYAQEVLMCISTGKMITDEDRIRHDFSRLHFKTEDEMLAGMPGFEEAVRNTGNIADLCSVEFDFSAHHMPKFEPVGGQSIEEFFGEEARAGLRDRFERFRKVKQGYLTALVEQQYSERLELEILLILKMGFAGYFLVVSDFIRWAKRNGIPVGPGRGSAAGSLVAYAMEITEVDPLPHKLLFERFLNPDRISLPDIDIDFCIYGREKVIEYVSNKYGRDKVAQICTFGTLKAKAAIKDVGRALGLSYAETDRIAKLMPAPRQGFDYPLAEALKMEKRLREYAEGEGKQLIDLAMKLEGLSRHTSTHAAGIVIGDKPIVEHLPLMMDKEGQVVTQLSMNWVEKIGLVKFDFLGLKTLTVLYDAVRMIKEARNVEIELNDLPLDDARTFRLVGLGRTIGVFQLESTGITEMVSRLKPSCFEDLVAILALYRPGPLDAGMVDHYINRKHGRERVSYAHPILEPILSDTYGIILYQEQIMQIARDLAGYSLAEADMLRRAMGKKKPEEMAKQRSIFLKGAKTRNIPEDVATDVFDQMETFARYGFNRSHSVAYAMISYQTAYLKAHYPRQFMAALMTSEMGDTDKTLKNINECREMGISIRPPDINRGQVGFSVSNNEIIFGLAAIKGVGEKAVQLLIGERTKSGPFSSFSDLCSRCDPSLLNRRVVENFIQAGAFDWTGLPRAHHFGNLDEILKRVSRDRQERDGNQFSLFGNGLSVSGDKNGDAGGPVLPEWPTTEKLAREKDALGFYLSGHPLERFRSDLSRVGAQTIHDAKSLSNDANVNVAGVVTFLKLKNTKKGERYASFILEDLLDTIEVLVWPDVYNQVQAILGCDDPVVVTARLEAGDERKILFASDVKSIIELRDQSAKEALIRIDASRVSPAKLTQLKRLIANHQGDCRVRIVMRKQNHSETVVTLPEDAKVAPSEEFCNSVERLFGEPAVSFR